MFRLAPALQAGSRLIQLPAEIKLLILRNLLRLYKPFYSQDHGGDRDREDYTDIIQKSAQLLCTCQLLYHEGNAILYGENTMFLRVTAAPSAGGHRHMDIEVLNCEIEVVAYKDTLDLHDSLFDLIRKRVDMYPDPNESSREALMEKAFLAMYPTLTMFNNFELFLCHVDQVGLFYIVRLLRGLFFNVHLAIDNFSDGEHKPFAPSTTVNSLRYLRLASLQFKTEDVSSALLDAVTRRHHVTDTWPIWRRFREDLVSALPRVDNQYFDQVSENSDTIEEIKEHCMNYDLEAVFASFKELMTENGLVRKWINLWVENHYRTLQLFKMECDAEQICRTLKVELQKVIEGPEYSV